MYLERRETRDKQIRLIGVARWPDPNFNKDDDSASHEYGRRFHATVMQAASHIANGDIGSFKQLWDLVADARYQWAVASKDPFPNRFKRDPRGTDSSTVIQGPYQYIGERLKQQEKSGQRMLERRRNHIASQFDPKKPFFMGHKIFDMKDALNGKNITLTSVAIPINAADFESESAQIMRGQGFHIGSPAFILHRHEHIGKIMNHMELMFANVTRTASSPGNLLYALGDMHWWLVHAMPDDRGSAAKAELAVRALAAAQGLDLPPFKRGTVPDLEAFLTDRKAFRAGYAEMFDGYLFSPSTELKLD
jgi:avirulence protein